MTGRLVREFDLYAAIYGTREEWIIDINASFNNNIDDNKHCPVMAVAWRSV